MQIVALTFFILWLLSLWLLVSARRRSVKLQALRPLTLMSGTLVFFVLSLAGLLFLRLLFAD
ncbi:MAG: hypothetical protein ACRERD_15830 [Candidatus Binatia bacterium]